jgi:dynein light chain LC8-type
MEETWQKMAFAAAREAFEATKVEKDIAARIKQAFTAAYEGTWHCIVGKHFGVSVNAATRCSIFFSYADHSVLLFKTED